MTANLPPLSGMQDAAVHHGEPRPAPRWTLADLGIVYSERDDHPRTYPPRDETPSILGYSEVYLHRPTGKWFAYHSEQGGSRESCVASREEGEAMILAEVEEAARFWDEKVAWRDAGDLRPATRRGRDPEPVVRVGGVHYVIGPEPARDRNGRFDRIGLGYGGSEFRFRMLADGREIISHNMWYQGPIPVEYLDRLPDNAEKLPSAWEERAARIVADHIAAATAADADEAD